MSNKKSSIKSDHMLDPNDFRQISDKEQFEAAQFEELVRSLQVVYTQFDVLRTLPHGLDGLKTSARRIVYGMQMLGARSGGRKVKSAEVVGGIVGNFHPHGDDAVYGTIATLAQDTNRRYPLVEGHGAWGDTERAPAASRYTKCRPNKYADALLGGFPGTKYSDFEIFQDAVPTVGAYNRKYDEPVALPSLFPNLVVNGGEGVASGVSTKATSHNLSEVMDLALYILDHKRVSGAKAREFMPGPDLPTECLVYDVFDKDGTSNIEKYYETGEGSFRMVARHHVEELTKAKGKKKRTHRIVITALPYQAKPGMVVAGVRGLVFKGLLPDDIECKDATSGKHGMRIYVNCGEHDPEGIWQTLLYYGNRAAVTEEDDGSGDDSAKVKLVSTTSLNYKQHVAMNVVYRRVQCIGVIDAIRLWLEHRRSCITRRARHQLNQIDAKIGRLNAQIKAAPMATEIVAALVAMPKKSSKADQEKVLRDTFDMDAEVAALILEMSVSQIVSLDVDELTAQRDALLPEQQELLTTLSDENRVTKIIRRELRKTKKLLGDERRSTIMDGDLSLAKPTTPKREVPVSKGYLLFTKDRSDVRWISKRTANMSLSTPNGPITEIVPAHTGLSLEGVTTTGEHVRGPMVSDINGSIAATAPMFAKVLAPGSAIHNVFAVDTQDETATPDIIMLTAQGRIKRVKGLSIAKHRRTRPAPIVGLDSDDSVLGSVIVTPDDDNKLLVAIADNGYAMSVPVQDVEAKGDKARGTAFIKRAKASTGGFHQIVHFGLYDPDTVLSYWTTNNTVGSFLVSDIPEASTGTLGKKITSSKHPIVGAVAGTEMSYTSESGDTKQFTNTTTPAVDLGDRNIARSVAPGIKNAQRVWVAPQ